MPGDLTHLSPATLLHTYVTVCCSLLLDTHITTAKNKCFSNNDHLLLRTNVFPTMTMLASKSRINTKNNSFKEMLINYKAGSYSHSNGLNRYTSRMVLTRVSYESLETCFKTASPIMVSSLMCSYIVPSIGRGCRSVDRPGAKRSTQRFHQRC